MKNQTLITRWLSPAEYPFHSQHGRVSVLEWLDAERDRIQAAGRSATIVRRGGKYALAVSQ